MGWGRKIKLPLFHRYVAGVYGSRVSTKIETYDLSNWELSQYEKKCISQKVFFFKDVMESNSELSVCRMISNSLSHTSHSFKESFYADF